MRWLIRTLGLLPLILKEDAEVAVAKIIRQNENDIGPRRRRRHPRERHPDQDRKRTGQLVSKHAPTLIAPRPNRENLRSAGNF
jgi:hypothetical protein